MIKKSKEETKNIWYVCMTIFLVILVVIVLIVTCYLISICRFQLPQKTIYEMKNEKLDIDIKSKESNTDKSKDSKTDKSDEYITDKIIDKIDEINKENKLDDVIQSPEPRDSKSNEINDSVQRDSAPVRSKFVNEIVKSTDNKTKINMRETYSRRDCTNKRNS